MRRSVGRNTHMPKTRAHHSQIHGIITATEGRDTSKEIHKFNSATKGDTAEARHTHGSAHVHQIQGVQAQHCHACQAKLPPSVLSHPTEGNNTEARNRLGGAHVHQIIGVQTHSAATQTRLSCLHMFGVMQAQRKLGSAQVHGIMDVQTRSAAMHTRL